MRRLRFDALAFNECIDAYPHSGACCRDSLDLVLVALLRPGGGGLAFRKATLSGNLGDSGPPANSQG
jgi:hypothetical protein